MRWLYALLVFLCCGVAWVKCATTWYVITGQVVTVNGLPAPNVTLAVEWRQFDRTEHVEAVSASDGTYKLEVPFYPYSGRSWLHGDLCKAALEKAQVSAQRGEVKKQRDVLISGEITSVDWVVE